MAAGSGIVAGIRFDLRRMHETWMELFFPRQRDAASSVLGKWKPKTTQEKVSYTLWYWIGVPLIGLLYPLVLFGYVLRFQSRRIDLTATRLGVVGVVVLSLVVWGALTAFVRFRFDTDIALAVGAASLVATLSAVLAVVFRSVGGRGTTVFLSYPFGVTALFLPPVFAALYSPEVASVVFTNSVAIGREIRVTLLNPIGVGEYLKENYELRGLAFAAMWFGISVPVGWFFGLLVTLADVVRPSGE